MLHLTISLLQDVYLYRFFQHQSVKILNTSFSNHEYRTKALKIQMNKGINELKILPCLHISFTAFDFRLKKLF